MLEIVLRKEKSHRSEPSLSLAVALPGAPAFRTGPAGIDRRHGDQPAAVPGQLVFQLTPQFSPALVEDRSIQPGLGPHLAARTRDAASRRVRHVAYPKILDTHNRVVFADRGRGFVQIIPTCIGYPDVKAGEPSLRSFPVLAELLFPAHGLLRFAQPCLRLTKTIPWSIERPIGKGRQADHPHVYAHSCGRSMDWRFYLTLGLNRNQPSATRQAHRDVLDRTQHFPAVAISHPAKLGKPDAVVILFQTGPLRIAKAGVLFLLLEPRLAYQLGAIDSALLQLLQRVQASCPRGIQVFQGLLQSLRRCLIQPVRLFVLLPVDQHSTQIRVAGMGPAEFEQLLLQGQYTKTKRHEPAKRSI